MDYTWEEIEDIMDARKPDALICEWEEGDPIDEDEFGWPSTIEDRIQASLIASINA